MGLYGILLCPTKGAAGWEHSSQIAFPTIYVYHILVIHQTIKQQYVLLVCSLKYQFS